MWLLLLIATSIAVLLISFLIGTIAGSERLATWTMGKLLRRELTKERKKR
jgi:hypothetical protein